MSDRTCQTPASHARTKERRSDARRTVIIMDIIVAAGMNLGWVFGKPGVAMIPTLMVCMCVYMQCIGGH